MKGPNGETLTEGGSNIHHSIHSYTSSSSIHNLLWLDVQRSFVPPYGLLYLIELKVTRRQTTPRSVTTLKHLLYYLKRCTFKVLHFLVP